MLQTLLYSTLLYYLYSTLLYSTLSTLLTSAAQEPAELPQRGIRTRSDGSSVVTETQAGGREDDWPCRSTPVWLANPCSRG